MRLRSGSTQSIARSGRKCHSERSEESPQSRQETPRVDSVEYGEEIPTVAMLPRNDS